MDGRKVSWSGRSNLFCCTFSEAVRSGSYLAFLVYFCPLYRQRHVGLESIRRCPCSETLYSIKMHGEIHLPRPLFKLHLIGLAKIKAAACPIPVVHYARCAVEMLLVRTAIFHFHFSHYCEFMYVCHPQE